MKILRSFFVVLLVVGVGTTVVYNYPSQAAANADPWGPEKEGIVLAQARTSPSEKESEGYQKKAQEVVNEYRGKLKELEAKAKNLGEKAKAEAREGMDELQKKIDAAEQKLKAIRSATGEAWEKLKADLDSSLESVKETYKKVVARFQQ